VENTRSAGTVTNSAKKPEPGHALAQPVDHADELVPGHEREDGVEVALVDVQIGAAQPDLADPDPDLAGAGLGGGQVGDGIAAGGVVHDSSHRDHSFVVEGIRGVTGQ
jgi:hypothetical protein